MGFLQRVTLLSLFVGSASAVCNAAVNTDYGIDDPINNVAVGGVVTANPTTTADAAGCSALCTGTCTLYSFRPAVAATTGVAAAAAKCTLKTAVATGFPKTVVGVTSGSPSLTTCPEVVVVAPNVTTPAVTTDGSSGSSTGSSNVGGSSAAGTSSGNMANSSGTSGSSGTSTQSGTSGSSASSANTSSNGNWWWIAMLILGALCIGAVCAGALTARGKKKKRAVKKTRAVKSEPAPVPVQEVAAPLVVPTTYNYAPVQTYSTPMVVAAPTYATYAAPQYSTYSAPATYAAPTYAAY